MDAHTLCVSDGGKLFVWGCGEHGQLGLGDVEDRLAPTVLEISSQDAGAVTPIAVGEHRTGEESELEAWLDSQ